MSQVVLFAHSHSSVHHLECPLTYLGVSLFVGIVLQRQQMTKKEALLEEAAMSVAGLQKVHVVGIILLFLLVVLIFALLQMKTITWSLLLLTNLILFIYLVKLMATTNRTEGSSDSKKDENHGLNYDDMSEGEGYSPFVHRTNSVL
jgi:hypothetical protein